MINPIKEKPAESISTTSAGITEEKFKNLIQEVYNVMVDYSRIRHKFLHKTQPMQIGNVNFWFESDPKTAEPLLRFNQSVKLWNEKSIRTDLDLHFHDLYYGNS